MDSIRNIPMNSSLVIYSQPEEMPRAEGVTVTVDGRDATVLSTKEVNYVVFAFTGKVQIRVDFGEGSSSDGCGIAHHVTEPSICPLSRNIPVSFQNETAQFELDEPRAVSLEIPGRKILYFFVSEPIQTPPDPKSENVLYYAAGKVHSDETIFLRSNQTLYIEGGAVLRSRVWADEADSVTITGHGILDFSHLPDKFRSICCNKCTNVDISGITMIDSKGWNITLHRCKGASVSDVKQIGLEVTSDGIDVVASEDILVDNCFLHNNDDCISIKCFQNATYQAEDKPNDPVSVRNVTVQNSVMCNTHAGNVLEIGFELRGDIIEDVTFINCDILGSHSNSGIFTIHNGDRALVRNIRYEDIRIEHVYSRLLDFTILFSRYSRDKQRGQIQNVTLKNITFPADEFNSISLIGGFDAEHMVRDIHFEDVYVDGKKVTHPDDLNLYTKYCKNITFQ